MGGFQLSAVLNGTTGGDLVYDGPYWKTRSPIEVLDRIQVPTFVVGGHHDLFQRGEPLIYERLKGRVPTRLLMGPWTHVNGSTGAGLPADGVPSPAEQARFAGDEGAKRTRSRHRRGEGPTPPRPSRRRGRFPRRARAHRMR